MKASKFTIFLFVEVIKYFKEVIKYFKDIFK